LYAKKLASQLAYAFQHTSKYKPIFTTLTLRNSPAYLPDQIRHLRAFFKRLRKTPFWRFNVTAGIAIIEVTWNNESNTWHPHLHILAWSKWLNRLELARTWHIITRNSFVVDVRRAHRGEHVAAYVSSYLTKPPNVHVLENPALLRQWIHALRASHWLIRFGKTRSLPKPPPEDKPQDWINICTLQEFLHRFNASTDLALALTIPHELLLDLILQHQSIHAESG
jgi:hypothetical protein